jgi:hypothetical protein
LTPTGTPWVWWGTFLREKKDFFSLVIGAVVVAAVVTGAGWVAVVWVWVWGSTTDIVDVVDRKSWRVEDLEPGLVEVKWSIRRKGSTYENLRERKSDNLTRKRGMRDVLTILVPTYSQFALQLLIKGEGWRVRR